MQKFLKVVLAIFVIITVLIINGFMTGFGISGAMPKTILVGLMFLAIRGIWIYENPKKSPQQ